MPNMMRTAEKALYKRSNKMLAGATKRYKKLMRQAAKAASAHKREQYLAAALGALVVTGVIASKLKARIDARRSAMAVRKPPAKKKRKKKAKAA